MAEILYNKRLSDEFYLMKAAHANQAEMGQFYMLRAWDNYPVLSRPVSVFDTDGETVSFLYKVVGKGTELLSRQGEGDSITLQGPYGNPFPVRSGRVAMVGGGVGIAPLFLAAKRIKALSPSAAVDLYLGFSGQPVLAEEYRTVADRVTVNVGGFVTDEIDPSGYDAVFTCGPEVMMKVLYEKCVAAGVGGQLLVSMENRMACGVGACLVCSCKTRNGNKKVCKDGPVFAGEEVFGL